MKKIILAAMFVFVSTGAFAKSTKVTKIKKHVKVVKVIPMKRGQKTVVCGKAGETITAALANINSDMAKPQVKSHTAKNLTVNRPFIATSAPVVHSEKRKRSAEVYVACVKVKKA